MLLHFAIQNRATAWELPQKHKITNTCFSECICLIFNSATGKKKCDKAAISSVSIQLEKHTFFIPINSFYKKKARASRSCSLNKEFIYFLFNNSFNSCSIHIFDVVNLFFMEEFQYFCL